MRTQLSQEHLSAIIERYFEEQGASVGFIFYSQGEDSAGIGALVDHSGSIDLPATDNWPDSKPK